MVDGALGQRARVTRLRGALCMTTRHKRCKLDTPSLGRYARPELRVGVTRIQWNRWSGW